MMHFLLLLLLLPLHLLRRDRKTFLASPSSSPPAAASRGAARPRGRDLLNGGGRGRTFLIASAALEREGGGIRSSALALKRNYFSLSEE